MDHPELEIQKTSVVVLISGNGSNLQALINAAKSPDCNYQIVTVISDKANAFGLQRAADANIPHHCIEPQNHTDRLSFDRALIEAIDRYRPNLIALAGFMRILSGEFINHYHGKILNIHPSLLPKYRGLHTHEKALQAGDTTHGASVHFVTEELDGGPVILQTKVNIMNDDTPETLAKRVLEKEHQIYPLAVQWYSSGRLRMSGDRVMLDNNPLNTPIDFATLPSGKTAS